MSCWLDPMMWPTCAATGAANAVVAVASIPDGIAHSFGDAAASAVTWLWQQVSQATTVNLTGPGIRDDLVITAAIAAVITMVLFCIQVIGSALRGSFAGLGRSVRGLGIAFVGAAFAIAVTQLTLAAVDALANGVVQAAVGQNIAQVGAELVAVSSLGVLGWAGLLLMSLVLLLAVAVIWCALMIRKMLIIIAAVFAPIAFSGAASDITKGWVRRWIEFTVALIFSKLILVVIFLIGLSMVNGAGSTGSTTNKVTNLAIGTLTLLLAGFAPWLAIKMVHFAGDAFHRVHAQAGAAGVGAATVASTPAKAASLYGGAKRVVGGLTPARSRGSGGARPAAFNGTGTPKPPATIGVAHASGPASQRPSTPPGSAGATGSTARPAGSNGDGSTASATSTSRSGGVGVAVATRPAASNTGDDGDERSARPPRRVTSAGDPRGPSSPTERSEPLTERPSRTASPRRDPVDPPPPIPSTLPGPPTTPDRPPSRTPPRPQSDSDADRRPPT